MGCDNKSGLKNASETIHVQMSDMCHQGLVVLALMEISDMLSPYLYVGRMRHNLILSQACEPDRQPAWLGVRNQKS